MPAPSIWAQRMADDLVEAGRLLGFISTKEVPPANDSGLKIDVVWRFQIDSLSGQTESSPIPEKITVVSIEIQYSKSDASISHGLIKGQYANSPYHIIVSYYPLTEDFKKALQITKPLGLKILDGEKFQDLQSWTLHLLSQKDKDVAPKKISQKVYKAILDHPDNMEEKIRESIEEEVELLFTPMKIHELYEQVSFPIGDGFILSESIISAVNFVKDILGKYKFSKTISVPASALFSSPATIEYPYHEWTKYLIGISSEKVYMNTPYANEIEFEARNASVKDGNGKVVMWESIPTEKVKSFILHIMEATRNYIESFVVNSDDFKELEQTISTIKKLKDNFTKLQKDS